MEWAINSTDDPRGCIDMKISLTKKISLGFILTAVISILIAVLISNYMVSKKFNNCQMPLNA